MTLKMKDFCEKCAKIFDFQSKAYICSYECTFCESCTKAMKHICPNCQGELVLRPISNAS
ncbi:MAG: DUF1272 domain-containing protein [Proteobacteria bacterium]|nr:DUF1272 domain-containing protein [Pseudomonadota bacterium]